jgi:hypothetical protein
MTKEEILDGLKKGRRLRCDRTDEPLLPWLLEHPMIECNFVQATDQSSYIQFTWKEKSDG